jgi:hypothetical protein
MTQTKTETEQLKAYIVFDEYGASEDGARIVFVKTPGEAKAIAASNLGIEFTEVRSDNCRRTPEYDEYAPGPVPFTRLVADGWGWFCEGCGYPLYKDTLEEGAIVTETCVKCRECVKRGEAASVKDEHDANED